jgi:hypothetical protein
MPFLALDTLNIVARQSYHNRAVRRRRDLVARDAEPKPWRTDIARIVVIMRRKKEEVWRR